MIERQESLTYGGIRKGGENVEDFINTEPSP